MTDKDLQKMFWIMVCHGMQQQDVSYLKNVPKNYIQSQKHCFNWFQYLDQNIEMDIGNLIKYILSKYKEKSTSTHSKMKVADSIE